MHGEQIITVTSSSAHCNDCSNYHLLDNVHPLMHLVGLMKDAAMAILLGNMGELLDGIQSLLPTDVGAMKNHIVP